MFGRVTWRAIPSTFQRTDVASEPVLQTCGRKTGGGQYASYKSSTRNYRFGRRASVNLDARNSKGRTGETHSQHSNLFALFDLPFPLELVQDPLGAVIPNPFTAFLVLDPHPDRDFHYLFRERVCRRPLAGRFRPCGRFDALQRFAEVDGRRTGSEEVGAAVEDAVEEELGRRREEGPVKGGRVAAILEGEEFGGETESGERGDRGSSSDLGGADNNVSNPLRGRRQGKRTFIDLMASNAP